MKSTIYQVMLMVDEYIVYSDEYEDPSKQYIMYGGIVCTEKRSKILNNQLKEIHERLDLGEMKWVKVTKNYLGKYKEWVDVFIDDRFARFSILVIDQRGYAWRNFRPTGLNGKITNDEKFPDAYHRFLRMTFRKIQETARWTVYHDEGHFKLERAHEIAKHFNKTHKYRPNESNVIRRMKMLNSQHDYRIQLVDVLLGALSYHAIGDIPTASTKRASARRELFEHIMRAIEKAPKTQKGLDKVTINWFHPEDALCPGHRDERRAELNRPLVRSVT